MAIVVAFEGGELSCHDNIGNMLIGIGVTQERAEDPKNRFLFRSTIYVLKIIYQLVSNLFDVIQYQYSILWKPYQCNKLSLMLFFVYIYCNTVVHSLSVLPYTSALTSRRLQMKITHKACTDI